MSVFFNAYSCCLPGMIFQKCYIIDSGKFMVEGADHPGIVHKVTSILSKNGLSIDKMETSDEIAPHGGTMLFKMKGRANALEPLASGFDISQIKKELAELGDSMNCDISLEDARDDDEHHQGSLFVG
jgi:glycine cleavage system transcriptional repressor